jgi:electron transfer flavoprotein alpha subunit
MVEPSESWVWLEARQGKILRESLEAVAAGLALQKEIQAPLVGLWAGVTPDAAQFQRLASLGLRRLIVLQGPGVGPQLSSWAVNPDPLLGGFEALFAARRPSHILFGATPDGLSLAPRLAALLGIGYAPGTTFLRRIGDVVQFTRPAIQDKLSEVLRFAESRQGVVSLLRRAFSIPEPLSVQQIPLSGHQVLPSGHQVPSSAKQTLMSVQQTPLSVQHSPLSAQQSPQLEIDAFRFDIPEPCRPLPQVLSREKDPPGALQLEDAEIVVAGGRGMGSGESFRLLAELANLLHGTVAASRIAVDLGWTAKERLVGQTGTKVAPELYIACGISGAPQHQAGMKDSRSILAINTDAQAPIFRTATWGILGDAVEVVSELIEQLRQRPGSRAD